MAETNKFIGELEDGGTVQTGDKIPVEREATPGVPQNFYVAVNSAGTKAASNASKPTVSSVDGATSPGHLAVFTDDEGTVRTGGLPSAIITGAPTLTPPVLTTDYIPIVRGGQVYLTTIDELLNAQSPSGEGGQFDFSDSQNSAYAAII